MKRLILPVLATLLVAVPAAATQTENNGLRLVPAPGKVTVDGKAADWDRSAGILICDDVETQRDRLGVWVYGMWDRDNLYLLAHFLDESPLNNPGQTIADYGFAGDSLQFRIITAPDSPRERTSHWTCWQGSDQRNLMDVAYGKGFNEGSLKDAKTKGAQQAFSVDADGKGYLQEIAIPWSLISKDGIVPAAGSSFRLTAEPNFTVGLNGRMSIKDIFAPNVTLDRVFTFMSNGVWGPVTVVSETVTPGPERLADGRTFPMHLEKGIPAIDWTGLIKNADLPGFKNIDFEVPADGYVSLNVFAADGSVARQLLNQAFYTRGKHTVKWDGLDDWNWKTPGAPLPAGDYSWRALWHPGIGLKLRGWADNGGSAPWDNGPGTNWGGDHGTPVAVTSDATQVYLGWGAAEAGKSVLALDARGSVKWSNNRAGIAGSKSLAVDGGVLYVLGGASGSESEGASLYKLDVTNGRYIAWGETTDADLALNTVFGAPTGAKAPPVKATYLAAFGGKLYLSVPSSGKVAMLDGMSGKLLQIWTVAAPGALQVNASGLYVLSGGKGVLHLDAATGAATPVVNGLTNATALAVSATAQIFVAEGDPQNQVKQFAPDGKLVRTIGRPGGRALLGPWQPDGMRFVSALALDASNHLWATENDWFPKRVSVWDIGTGGLVKEYFGPTSYGALGGAISPLDPDVMVGQGCEWRLDAKTGQARCVAVITRDGMEVSRFGTGDGKRQYLYVAPGWIAGSNFITVFERVGEANWKTRGKFTFEGKDAKDPAASTGYWADANGDETVQPEEQQKVTGNLLFSRWFMGLTPDLSIYEEKNRFRVTGFTAAGAPQYDLSKPETMPAVGLGSADGLSLLQQGDYGVNNGWFKAYDTVTGKLRWKYPDNFVGVHGSHNATPPQVGMIRGSYGPAGVAKLPAPLGNMWVIASNVGEWHLVNQDGFYLTRLFQGDPLKMVWPAQAVPGSDMANTPPGMGGEDFGGSVTQGVDGQLYLQSGKTAFWNLQVTGLENVKEIKGGKLTLKTNELTQATSIREAALQTAVGTQKATIKSATVAFSGNLDVDFRGQARQHFAKQDEAAVGTSAAWDTNNLYVGWEVKDSTPWVNGATEAAQMYIGGDTVDLQLGTAPTVDPKRSDAALGDLRLSIGNFQGKPAAVLYRKVATVKKPKVFSSGVIKAYPMDYVEVVPLTDVKVTTHNNVYVVEASIPWSQLGVAPAAGLTLRGDFGATHGDVAGQRTRLRSYWSNQHTGIVDDAVFELMLEPRNWGEITLGG